MSIGKNYDILLQAIGAGFVGLWLFDILTSNTIGRVLHQAGATPGQTCVNCEPSTTTPGSFDCTTCAATGTVGAPAFGCPTCTPSATVPGTFDCTGCEGYTCDTCTADATGFTCTNCVDALTAVTTAAPVTPPADACASVATPCIFVNGGCARQGNSSCTCTGCSTPSTSTSSSCSSSNCIYDTAHKACLCKGTTTSCSGCKKPSTPAPKTLAGTNPKTGTTNPAPTPVSIPKVTPVSIPKSAPPVSIPKPAPKICPPLVKC